MDADAVSADLVFVARADPPAGGSYGGLALFLLPCEVERPVVGHDDMRVETYYKALGCNTKTRPRESFHLFEKFARVEDDPVSDHALFALVQNSGRDEVEDVLSPHSHQGVACVVSALEPDDTVGLLGQQIDNFAFTLITPLGAHNDNVRHVFFFPSAAKCRPSPAHAPNFCLQRTCKAAAQNA